LPGEPLLWFAYHFILRLGFLEGRPGLIASQIRASYIAQVRAKLFELESNRLENISCSAASAELEPFNIQPPATELESSIDRKPAFADLR